MANQFCPWNNRYFSVFEQLAQQYPNGLLNGKQGILPPLLNISSW